MTMQLVKSTLLFLYQINHINLHQWDVETAHSANDDQFQQD